MNITELKFDQNGECKDAEYIERMEQAGRELASADCADLRKLLDKWADEHIGGECDSAHAEKSYRNVIEDDLNTTIDDWWDERVAPFITKASRTLW